MMKRPFLDDWIARCCGLEVLNEESLRRYQLNKINEVLRYTERNSLLYRKRLAGVFERHGEAIRAGMWPASPDDVTQLPFTTARDLEDGWKRFVCVPLDAIARMVTLSTSGTTGEPKRLAFAYADLERTLDFFAHGISVLVRPGDTVLILLPGAERPDGVTDLLIRALPRIGAGASPEIPRLSRLAFAGNWSCIARTVWSPRRDSCVVFWVRIRPPREFGPFCRARNLCRKIWKKRLSTAGIVRFSITTASLRQATAAGSSAAGNRGTICAKAICFSKSSIRFPVSLCPTGRRVKWSSPH